MTDITITESQDDTERKRRLALLKAVGWDRLPPEQQAIAVAISNKYDLDPLLRHVVIVEGRPFLSRDALLHIAHRSGKFDGLEVTEPVEIDGYWRCTATVYRTDMSRPFTYPGRYPVKGKNIAFGPEMAIKVAESMALRRAFDVSAPVVEERWDRDLPETPVTPPRTLAERVTEKRQALAANGVTVDVLPDDESVLGTPMTEAESADLPSLMCEAENATLDTGPCDLLPGHAGPHKNAGGVWPNR
jgi:hypothetical protein